MLGNFELARPHVDDGRCAIPQAFASPFRAPHANCNNIARWAMRNASSTSGNSPEVTTLTPRDIRSWARRCRSIKRAAGASCVPSNWAATLDCASIQFSYSARNAVKDCSSTERSVSSSPTTSKRDTPFRFDRELNLGGEPFDLSRRQSLRPNLLRGPVSPSVSQTAVQP